MSTRHVRNLSLAGSLAAVMAVSPLAALAQDAQAVADDDWEHEVDASGQRQIAAVRYATGQGIIVQCQDGDLKVVLLGLPTTTGPGRTVIATRADGRTDRQTWTAVADGAALIATLSGRDARFLRGGGRFELNAAEGEAQPLRAVFDLPTQWSRLDQTISACGWALEDERDALARAPADLTMGAAQAALASSNAQDRLTGVIDVSCVIRSQALTDCRADHQRPLSRARDQTSAASLNGRGVATADPQGGEGSVYYTTLQIVEGTVVIRH